MALGSLLAAINQTAGPFWYLLFHAGLQPLFFRNTPVHHTIKNKTLQTGWCTGYFFNYFRRQIYVRTCTFY